MKKPLIKDGTCWGCGCTQMKLYPIQVTTDLGRRVRLDWRCEICYARTQPADLPSLGDRVVRTLTIGFNLILKELRRLTALPPKSGSPRIEHAQKDLEESGTFQKPRGLHYGIRNGAKPGKWKRLCGRVGGRGRFARGARDTTCPYCKKELQARRKDVMT